MFFYEGKKGDLLNNSADKEDDQLHHVFYTEDKGAPPQEAAREETETVAWTKNSSLFQSMAQCQTIFLQIIIQRNKLK